MRFQLSIELTPNPTNSNEKNAGNSIIDDRFYGISPENIILIKSTQSLTSSEFSKPQLSNTLTLISPTETFALSEKITVDIS